MPSVVIKTGLKTPDGYEEELREYICDFSGCSNVATHVIGCVVELGQVVVVCTEHAPRRRPYYSYSHGLRCSKSHCFF